MKLIFDIRNVVEPEKVLRIYMDTLKSINFEADIWITQLQKDTIFKDFDKFYRGISLKAVDEAN